MIFFELLIISSWTFWLFLLPILILVSMSADRGYLITSTGIFLVFLALVSMSNNIDIISYIGSNPITSISAVLGYFGVGVIWAFIKWYCWLKKEKSLWLEDSIHSVIRSTSDGVGSNITSAIPPKITNYKDQIISWMALWPCSVFWTVINDPVRKVFELTFVKLANTFQSMADREFNNVNKTK